MNIYINNQKTVFFQATKKCRLALFFLCFFQSTLTASEPQNNPTSWWKYRKKDFIYLFINNGKNNGDPDPGILQRLMTKQPAPAQEFSPDRLPPATSVGEAPLVTHAQAKRSLSSIVNNSWNSIKSLFRNIRFIRKTYSDYYKDDPNTVQNNNATQQLTTYCSQQLARVAAVFNRITRSLSPFTSKAHLALYATTATALLTRDFYHHFFIIKPTVKKLTPFSQNAHSIAHRAFAITHSLYHKNNIGSQRNTLQKITDLIETLHHDISTGAVIIRNRKTNSPIDPTIPDEKDKALDRANINYTIKQELAEIKAALTYLQTYDHPIDWAYHRYQRGWKFDLRKANNKAHILPGTQFYEITTQMAEKRDQYMQEKEGMWGTIRIPKINVPCGIYPKNLPYYLQPSRWLCSHGMPFSYNHAKQLWWQLIQQRHALKNIQKLLIQEPRV